MKGGGWAAEVQVQIGGQVLAVEEASAPEVAGARGASEGFVDESMFF